MEAEPARGRAITIRFRGRDVFARPEFIRDPDEVERLLRRMVSANPRVASFVLGRNLEIDRGKVEAAVRRGFVIVRWHLDQTVGRPPEWSASEGADDDGRIARC